MSRTYEKSVIKSLLRQEANARRVIEHFFPEAREAPDRQGYVISSVAGGEGQSCTLRVSGEFAGTFHDFNPAAEHIHGDLIEAVRARKETSFPHALRAIGDLLSSGAQFSVLDGRKGKRTEASRSKRKLRRTTADLRVANTEALDASIRALRRDKIARDYLRSRGLSEDTISHFSLGIFPERKAKQGGTYGPVISVPVIGEQGKPLSAYAWYALDGWTQGEYSTRIWPAVPRGLGHLFHEHLATCSTALGHAGVRGL